MVGASGLRPSKAEIQTSSGYGITPSLNAYSFNKALLEEGMSLDNYLSSLHKLVSQLLI